MFGWEAFLTDRDKELLKARPALERTEFGQRPVLLAIDLYYASVGLEREPLLESVKRWPASSGLEGWEAIDRIAGLMAVARECGVPVIHIRRLSDFPYWNTRRNRRPGEDAHVSGNSQLDEIVAEVAPQGGELVIRKSAPSAFQGTPLAYELISRGVDTIITCGESTSGCVRATVVDGLTNGFRMGVVAECCYDRTQASHFINLFDMHQKYARVIHQDEAEQYFARTGNRSLARRGD